ncbi:MAG: recombination regulator RecX [Clostridiaceae bacterium]
MNKITSIEEQKKNKERVNIYINYEFVFACSKLLAIKYSLVSGQIVDTDKLSKIAYEDNISKAKEYGLRIVERSFKTKNDVTRKLVLKEYDENTISYVISFLEEYKFIDDNKYVNMYINDYKISKSKKAIYYNLSKKGIDKSLIDKAFGEIDEDFEEKSAYKLGEKKYKTLKNSEDFIARKKIGDFLFRKGYKYETIKKVLNKILDEGEFYE